MEFEFISDDSFQDILKRDFQELTKCREAKSSKSVLILSGSILEALLTDYFQENLPAGYTTKTILETSLSILLDLAETEKIISKSEKSLASVIKDYRNLIHPGREVRKKESFDHETAELAFSILGILITRIEQKYREKFSFSAKDILDNLNRNWNYRSIYSMVITKLSSGEKGILLDEFVTIENRLKSKFEDFREEFNYEDSYDNIEDVKDFVTELKPLLSNETILSYLKKLHISVTSGHCLQALALYNLLHEDVHLLDKEEQEIIAIYMLSLYQSIFENSRDLCYEKTYSTVGKYIHTQKGINELKGLAYFCAVHFGGKGLAYEFDVLEQIFNSLHTDTRNEVTKCLEEFLTPKSGMLPQDIYENFVIEAVKRELIKYGT